MIKDNFIITPESGSNNGKITVVTNPNKELLEIKNTISVHSGNIIKSVNLIQKANLGTMIEFNYFDPVNEGKVQEYGEVRVKWEDLTNPDEVDNITEFHFQEYGGNGEWLSMKIPRDTNSYKPNIAGFGIRIIKGNNDNCKLDINRKYPIAISRVNITEDLGLLRTLNIHVWRTNASINTKYLLDGYDILCKAISDKFIDGTLTKRLELLIDDSNVGSTLTVLSNKYTSGNFRVNVKF